MRIKKKFLFKFAANNIRNKSNQTCMNPTDVCYECVCVCVI
jgi:hypothetical protein